MPDEGEIPPQSWRESACGICAQLDVVNHSGTDGSGSDQLLDGMLIRYLGRATVMAVQLEESQDYRQQLSRGRPAEKGIP